MTVHSKPGWRGSEPSTNANVDVFFGDDYLAAETHFDTTRKSGLLATDLRHRPVGKVRVLAPGPAGRADVEQVHDPGYVDAVLTGQPRRLAESSGLEWDPGLATAVLASTGGCMAAATSAWRDGVAGSLSSGLHHAQPDRGAGFCTFNGVALAARVFLDLGAERVLVVDLDAHCGGGTSEILGGDQRITQLDVATDPFDSYQPSGESTLDLVDHAGDYLDTIVRRFDGLAAERFDAVVYNAGMDPHEGCDIGGLDGITDEILAERERLVFDWAVEAALPIAFVLAGGYRGNDMTPEHLTALHRSTVETAARSTPRGGGRTRTRPA